MYTVQGAGIARDWGGPGEGVRLVQGAGIARDWGGPEEGERPVVERDVNTGQGYTFN